MVIGIAGGSGSGKTTVVKKIAKKIPANRITIISQDAYYRDNSSLPLEERQKINFDHPDAIEFELLSEHIKLLKKGETIQQPQYSYITCTRSKETIPILPTNVIIVEGILILTNSEIRNSLDLKVFVQADSDDRLSRIIKRDMEERGRNAEKVIERYYETVKPMHQQFIEPSKQYADIIIPQGGHNNIAINMLVSAIQNTMH